MLQQFVLAIYLTVLGGLLLTIANRSSSNRLAEFAIQMSAFRTELTSRIDRLEERFESSHAGLRTELTTRIDRLEEWMESSNAGLRTEMREQIAGLALRTEVREQIGGLRGDLVGLEQRFEKRHGDLKADIADLRMESTFLRSDLTQIALALGVSRPRPLRQEPKA